MNDCGKMQAKRTKFPPSQGSQNKKRTLKNVQINPSLPSTTVRNRTGSIYAVYTSVLDGNKNSKIYFYPPVNMPFHNSCPDNVYGRAICGSTSSEENASGICILGGRRDVTVMSLKVARI